LLVFMTAITMSRMALMETVLGAAALILTGALYFRLRRGKEVAVAIPSVQD
jgi:hypothetical protein